MEDQNKFETLLQKLQDIAKDIGEELEIQDKSKLLQDIKLNRIDALLKLREEFSKKKREGYETKIKNSQEIKQLADQIADEHRKAEQARLQKIKFKIVQEHIPSKQLEIRQCQKYQLAFQDKVKKNIRILMIGETGSGKSTLINTLCNYIFGVNMNDTYRYKLVQDPKKDKKGMSQTDSVEEYYLPDFDKGFNLTLLDSPGFGDTRGIKQDEQNRQYIYDKMKLIKKIHAICYVFKATETRTTKHAQYINDSVLKMFGSDAKTNIFIMFTFSETDQSKLEEQPGVEIINKDLKTPNAGNYFFENKAVNDTSSGDQKDINQILWDFNCKNFDAFFQKVSSINPLNLDQSIQVQDERTKIETFLDRMIHRIQEFTNLKYDMQKAQQNLRTTFDKKIAYQEYEQTLEIFNNIITKADTYCEYCCEVCHVDCTVFSDYKSGCLAFSGEYCKACSNKCHYSKHKLGPGTKWIKETKYEKKINQQLKDKYDENLLEENKLKQIEQQIHNNIQHIENEINEFIQIINRAINKLNRIALKPPTSTSKDYIEEMIKDCINSNPPNKTEQLKFLEDLKKKAEMLEKIQGGVKDFNTLAK
ncbi:hypothetical protein ABPG72_005304 [Tetrahymena utriculariae]